MLSDQSGDSVEELGPEDTGRWLVVTEGTQHLWDLDRMEYTRSPGPESKAGTMMFDGQPMRITRVVRWPKVGQRPWLWYDDPDAPHAIEHYRISSEVRSITRLVHKDPQAETGEGETDET